MRQQQARLDVVLSPGPVHFDSDFHRLNPPRPRQPDLLAPSMTVLPPNRLPPPLLSFQPLDMDRPQETSLPTGFWRCVDICPAREIVNLRVPRAEFRYVPDLFSGRGLHDELAEGRRSEEHTSELESRSDLVCRLLLEQ